MVLLDSNSKMISIYSSLLTDNQDSICFEYYNDNAIF